MKTRLVYRYNSITHILLFEFFLKSSRNAETLAGSFLMCCERGVILEKLSRWRILSTCLIVYFRPVFSSIISENCLVSIEQNFLFADFAFFVNSRFSFARAVFVSNVGLPRRGMFLTLPVFWYFTINRLIADWWQPTRLAICSCVLPSLDHRRTSSLAWRVIIPFQSITHI